MRFFDKCPEWQDGLDETACPDGTAACPFCEAEGAYDGRRKMPLEHRPNCAYAELRALLSPSAEDNKT